MSRIEPAQGNQKLTRTDVPMLSVELARPKLKSVASSFEVVWPKGHRLRSTQDHTPCVVIIVNLLMV